jgi:protease-4
MDEKLLMRLVELAEDAKIEWQKHLARLRWQTWLKTGGTLLLLAYIFFVFNTMARTAAAVNQSGVPELSGASLMVQPEYLEYVPGATDKIIVVPITGEISDSERNGENMVKSAIAKLRLAQQDSAVKAVVLEMQTPGGEVNGSDLIWNEVMKVKASSKPVVAFFNGISASGGYYISAPADKIVATPATITGSIGVIAMIPNFSGLMQKVGLQMVTVKSGKSKDTMSPFRPVTPADRRSVQKRIDILYQRFVWIVSSGRKMELQKVRKLADGGVFLAEEAVQNGLIDEVGYRERAFALARELAHVEKASVVLYKSRKNLFDGLLNGKFSMKMLDPLPQAEGVKYYYLYTE